MMIHTAKLKTAISGDTDNLQCA